MKPREKFTLWGVSSLDIKELIAVLLSTGSKTSNVFQVASKVSKLLKENRYTYDILKSVSGVGSVKAMKLLCALELGSRLSLQEVEKPILNTSEKVYETLRGIGGYRQEHFVCVFLNARYELMNKKTVGIGTVDSVHILPRDIILCALEFNASYVVLAHNHPSGNLTPSQGDFDVTNRIKQALDLVGITLLDHLIITKREWKSIV